MSPRGARVLYRKYILGKHPLPKKYFLCWSTARVIAILKRPLQYYKCLGLGHLRATFVSAVNRGHLCYRCGESGRRARGCPASAPKFPSVRIAQGTRRPQDGRSGMCCPENQEEATRPRISGGKNARQHHERNCRWPGGGHGVGPITSSGSSKETSEGREGRVGWNGGGRSLFPLTAAWPRLGTSWTGLANASDDTSPTRCSSSGISTPTPRSWETPRMDIRGREYPIGLQVSGSYW